MGLRVLKNLKSKYSLPITMLLMVFVMSLMGCQKEAPKEEDHLEEAIVTTEEYIPTEAEIRQKENQLTHALIDMVVEGRRIEEGNASYVELKEMNPKLAENVIEILEYFKMANRPGFVQTEEIPSGLPDNDSLCIVVLGFQLNADGSMQEELINRLNCALSCASTYPSSYILVTGGGTAIDSPSDTEADAMAKWLIENGIARERVIIENSSRTTVENALFSCAILKDDYPSVKELLLVTCDYHIPLGCALFEAQSILLEDAGDGFHVTGNYAFDTESHRYFSMSSQGNCIYELITRQGEY